MKGITDFYLSHIYKRRSSTISNYLLFYFVVFYMIFYSIYYANLVQLWFDSRLNDYSDYVFYYIISCIFRLYELLFKGITLYATYFPSISIYRLEGGLLAVDNLRGIVGSQFKAENNTFLQRSFPKPHFTFLLLCFFFFFLRRTIIVLKLFVKKKRNVFFFKFMTICKLYFIFLVAIMLFVFFSEYQLNNYIFIFYKFYKLIADFFFANFIEINERFLTEILSNNAFKMFKVYYVFYLELILSNNETIWFNVTTITCNNNFCYKYLLYIFFIIFKFIFSLIFLFITIVYYFLNRIYFLNPIYLELPEFFFKIISGKKSLFEGSFDFTEKMLQTCMNLYSQNDFAQYTKTNPFRKTYYISRSVRRRNKDIVLSVHQGAVLKSDFRNRINGSFRFSLKRLRINALNREYYYFFTKDRRVKLTTPYTYHNLINHQKKVHEGRIWQMSVDKPNYNLLYFYNQTARTSTGKKTTLRKMLDNITEKLICDTYFYEHLIHEIKIYESLFPFNPIKIEDKNYDHVKKIECEANHLLTRILYQDDIFLKRKIQKKQLFPSMAFWYNKILTEMVRNLRYEFDWFYFIRTGRLKFRHWRIKRSMRRKLRLYYFEETPVIRSFLKKHPKRRCFKILQKDIIDLRKLINGLYDSSGIIHIEAINALFNGHLNNRQFARYHILEKKPLFLLKNFHERIFKEIIYGYDLAQNAIYNPLKDKIIYKKFVDRTIRSEVTYRRYRYKLIFIKRNFGTICKYMRSEIEVYAERKLMSTVDRNRVGYARKLRRFSLEYADRLPFNEEYSKRK